jgi:tetratricopeptide (TPR) repeat protein
MKNLLCIYILAGIIGFCSIANAQNKIRGPRVIAAPKTANQTYAIIIGVSEYANVRNLKFAHTDALDFKNYLTDYASVPADHIYLRLDKDASNENIQRAITEVKKVLKPNDLVYFYFAGHGDYSEANGGALLLLNDAPDKIDGSKATGFMKLSDVRKVFDDFTRKTNSKVVFIADACRSGGLGSNDAREIATAQQLNDDWNSIVKILSCQPSQVSFEADDLGHGIFSHYLVKGLMGPADLDNNDIISLGELKTYLESKVGKRTGKEQIPVALGDDGFTVGKINRAKKIRTEIDYADFTTETNSLAVAKFLTKLRSEGDTTIRQFYELFQQALYRKELIKPENKSALFYFNKIPSDQKYREGRDALKYNLKDALQEKANSYFLQDDQRNLHLGGGKRSSADTLPTVDDAINELHAAQTLVGKEDKSYNDLEAMVLNLETRKTIENLGSIPGYLTADKKKIVAECILKIQKSAQLNTQLYENYRLLARLDQLIGNNDSSVEENYLKSIKIAPYIASSYNDLAVFYNQTKQNDEAIKYLKKSLEIDSAFAEAHYNLALAYKTVKKYSEAIQSYRAAFSADSNFAIAPMGIGSVFMELNQNDSAAAYYEKAIKIDPENVFVLYNTGMNYYALANSTETSNLYWLVIKHLEKAIKFNGPNLAHTSNVLRASYEQLSAKSLVEQNFEEATANRLMSYYYFSQVLKMDSSLLPAELQKRSYQTAVNKSVKKIKKYAGKGKHPDFALMLAKYYALNDDNENVIIWINQTLKSRYFDEQDSKEKTFFRFQDIDSAVEFDKIRKTKPYQSLMKKHFPNEL